MTETVLSPPTPAWSNVPAPTTHQRVSVTEIRDLLRCTKKHDYAYRQGLRPATTPSYFGKGRYLHGLEEVRLRSYMNGNPITDVSTLGKQVLENMRAKREEGDPSATVGEPDRVEVNKIYADYLTQVDMTGVTVKGVEVEFYADVGWRDSTDQPVLLYGFIDALLERDEQTWLIEHKTAGRAWSQGQFAFDYQTRLYSAAIDALSNGTQLPVGTLFNFFYPKRWETKMVFVTPDESRRLLDEVQLAINLRDSGIIVRQPHWGCQDCSFRNLCHAELIGADSTTIRQHEFTVDADKVARFAEED